MQLLVRHFEHRGHAVGAEEGDQQLAVGAARRVRVDRVRRPLFSRRCRAECHRCGDVDGHAVGDSDVVRTDRRPVVGQGSAHERDAVEDYRGCDGARHQLKIAATCALESAELRQ